MRALIGRGLGPAFEAAVRYFDPTVEFDEHVRFIESALASRIPEAAGPSSVVRSVDARVRDALGMTPLPVESEAARERGVAELASLEAELLSGASAASERMIDVGLLGLLNEARQPAVNRRSTHDSPWVPRPDWESLEALHTQTAPLQARMRRGLLANGDARAAIEPALAQREPRHWFLVKQGVRYGSADLLRSALDLLVCNENEGDASATLPDTLREILDRLVRHVEVRRDAALGFAPESLSPESDEFLERIRFTLALLDGARAFRDARYLNTALKLNDGHLRILRADRGAPSNPRVASRLLHYLVAVSAQEEEMRRLFP